MAQCASLCSVGYVLCISTCQPKPFKTNSAQVIWGSVKEQLVTNEKVSYSSFFNKVRDHDNDSCILFPNHPPEIFKGRL